MQTGSLGSRAANTLDTRLGRLYRGCGASTVAAISVFPKSNVTGHVAERFWEAMVLSLDGQGRNSNGGMSGEATTRITALRRL